MAEDCSDTKTLRTVYDVFIAALFFYPLREDNRTHLGCYAIDFCVCSQRVSWNIILIYFHTHSSR